MTNTIKVSWARNQTQTHEHYAYYNQYPSNVIEIEYEITLYKA